MKPIKKKICILSHGPIYNDGRVLRIIDFFASYGLEVFVFFPINESQEKNFIRRGKVHINPVKHRNSIYRIILRHTIYPAEYNYLATEAKMDKACFDYIYVNDLPSLMAGYILKRKNLNSILIYDSHEIYNETINQFFPENGGFIKSAIKKGFIALMHFLGGFYEKNLIKKVDLFITVNESLKNYFQEKYRVQEVKVMMNCPSIKASEKHEPVKIDFRKDLNWSENDLIFIYQGVLNQGRGLEILLKTFAKCEKRIKLIIVGDGALRSKLETICKENNISNRVKFFGFVPHDKLNSYTRGADVGVNLLEGYNLSKAMASPNKLFEYIHAGIPVVCSNTFENKKVISKFDVGILVENTKEDILSGLLFFSEEENVLKKKKNIRKAVKHYNWENQITVLKEFLKETRN